MEGGGGGFHTAMRGTMFVRNGAVTPGPSRECDITFFVNHSFRIYPYPMVWPLPRPWSETMVSIPFRAQKTLEIKGFLGLERPFLDLVSQTPRPRGRGRPLFAELREDRHLRNNCVTVQWRRAGRRASPYRHPG